MDACPHPIHWFFFNFMQFLDKKFRIKGSHCHVWEVQDLPLIPPASPFNLFNSGCTILLYMSKHLKSFVLLILYHHNVSNVLF